MSRKVLATADADLTRAPKLNCPTIGGCYHSTRNGLKAIALGHSKLASWGNLASAPTTAISLANALPRVLMCFFVRNNLRPGGHCVQLKQVETSGRHFVLVRFAGYV